jgi:hypothetical protein
MARIEKRQNGQTVAHVSFNGRMAKLLAGEISVRELDDVELARGQCRDENGRFTGPVPDAVPKQIHDERLRRLFERGDEKFQAGYLEAVDVFREVMNDPNNTAADRMRAAEFFIHNVRGKVPDRVVLGVEDKIERLFRDMLEGGELEELQSLEAAEQDIVDAEVVEDGVAVG